MSERTYASLKGVINGLLIVIEFFIGLRILFRFFSANPDTPFVALVYSVSDFFMAPFQGIFSNFVTNTGVLDTVAIISLISYALLGWLANSLINNALRTKDAKDQATVEEIEKENRMAYYSDVRKNKPVNEEPINDSQPVEHETEYHEKTKQIH